MLRDFARVIFFTALEVAAFRAPDWPPERPTANATPLARVVPLERSPPARCWAPLPPAKPFALILPPRAVVPLARSSPARAVLAARVAADLLPLLAFSDAAALLRPLPPPPPEENQPLLSRL